MLEAFIATTIFWLSFALSPGPFWLAWMSYTAQNSLKTAYRVYLSYLFTAFFLQTLILCWIVLYFGATFSEYFDWLYLLSGIYIAYLAITSFKLTLSSKPIKFRYLEMSMISLTNPKVYLSVPAGAISATYTGSIFLDSLIFAGVVMLPCVLLGSIIYAGIAKASNHLLKSKNFLGMFSSGLLALYAVYLFYEYAQIHNFFMAA